jgi:hypothetical protein
VFRVLRLLGRFTPVLTAVSMIQGLNELGKQAIYISAQRRTSLTRTLDSYKNSIDDYQRLLDQYDNEQDPVQVVELERSIREQAEQISNQFNVIISLAEQLDNEYAREVQRRGARVDPSRRNPPFVDYIRRFIGESAAVVQQSENEVPASLVSPAAQITTPSETTRLSASPISYVTNGVRQEQLQPNISSVLQLLSGIEFHSIKIEAKSIEFDGTIKTASVGADQYATRIAAPAAESTPASIEITPESTPTSSTRSTASTYRSTARPAPGGSGMLSRLGRSIFGGGSASPSAGSPSAPSSAAAQQTAAAPAIPSIGGGGGGGGSAGASASTITEVVERGPGFNVVKYDDGRVERRTGSRNWRNNNPGNIEFGDFARGQGAIGTDGRFAIFPTYEMGKRAKEALLFEGRNYSNLTIAQAITRYAPPSENDTAMYIRVAASAAGVAPSTPMKDLNSGQRQALLAAMERVEGFRVGNVQIIQEGTAVAAAEQAPPGPGPTLAAEGTQMAAADQAQVRGQGQDVVVQILTPVSPQQRIVSGEQPTQTSRGEVSLNRRLEKQVA